MEIWTALTDDHNISIAYGGVRPYVHDQTVAPHDLPVPAQATGTGSQLSSPASPS